MSENTQRLRTVLMTLVILVLLSGMVSGRNHIRLGCPVTMNPIVPGDSVTIPVYIMNDAVLSGISMGFIWNDRYVRVSSTDMTGSVLTPEQISSWHEVYYDEGIRKVAFSWVGSEGDTFAEHPNETLLFSMNVVVLSGATESCVSFDSAYVWPSPFRFFLAGSGYIVPYYIECGAAEIILGDIQCPVPNNAPIAICHDVYLSCDSTCHADASIDNGSFDPDSGDILTLNQVPTGPYPVGNTLVTLIAADNHNASRQCQAFVHVSSGMGCPEQQYPPVAICRDVSVTIEDGTCYVDAEVDDGSYDPDAGCVVTLRQVPPGPYHAGSTLVSLIATDCYGVADTCQATVHVDEVVAPTISCPSVFHAEVVIGQPGRIVYFPLTATDVCTANPAIVATPPSGSYFPVGTTPVIAVAIDGSGNADTCEFVVQVDEVAFFCGDATTDFVVDISDVVYLIAYIFSGGSEPSPLLAGDANCDGAVDISDVVYLIAYIFSGGLAPCALCP